jgi:hypothetical protein
MATSSSVFVGIDISLKSLDLSTLETTPPIHSSTMRRAYLHSSIFYVENSPPWLSSRPRVDMKRRSFKLCIRLLFLSQSFYPSESRISLVPRGFPPKPTNWMLEISPFLLPPCGRTPRLLLSPLKSAWPRLSIGAGRSSS